MHEHATLWESERRQPHREVFVSPFDCIYLRLGVAR